MRYKNFTILSGVIAALALAQGPAQAIELLGNNVSLGGGNNPSVSVNTGGTSATVNANTNSTSTATANANLSSGSNSALPNSLSANANIDLGDVTDGGRVTVDLNGDGVIDDNDTAMAKLDINKDGILNFLDDANDDGVISDADLDVIVDIGEDAANGIVTLGLVDETGGVASFGIGGLPPAGDVDPGKVIGDIEAPQLPSIDIGPVGEIFPGPGEGPPPGVIPNPGVNPGPVPGVTDSDLTNTFRNLNDDDIADLRIKCVDVMANPNAFDAATIAICRALASL
jgi:hypothetical protein